MGILKYILLVLVALFILYIALRLAFTAFFRSWYGVHRKYSNNKIKEVKHE
jgi:hypothetical protein